MYKNISPFISAYRKNYNTQHIMLRLVEEGRKKLGVGGVLMDLFKAFDYVHHDILLSRLAAYSVDESFLCYHRTT